MAGQPAGLALALALPVSLFAQHLMRQVNLTELAQRAKIIVQGRVVDVSYESLPGYANIPTVRVTLQVERMLRGPAQQRFTFRQYLPGPAGFQKTGKRGYQAGQRLLLFLPNPSQYGLSSPLGHEQGRFHILRDQRGNEVIANEFGNAGLLRNVAQDAEKAGASLSASQLRLVSIRQGPLPLNEFVSLVEHLGSLPRIE